MAHVNIKSIRLRLFIHVHIVGHEMTLNRQVQLCYIYELVGLSEEGSRDLDAKELLTRLSSGCIGRN